MTLVVSTRGTPLVGIIEFRQRANTYAFKDLGKTPTSNETFKDSRRVAEADSKESLKRIRSNVEHIS